MPALAVPALPTPAVTEPSLAVAPAPPAKRPRARLKLPSAPKLARPSVPKLPKVGRIDPSSRTWQFFSILAGGLAVIAILALIQGGDSGTEAPEVTPAAGPPAESNAVIDATGGGNGGRAGKSGDGGAAGGAGSAELVSGSTYSLALPAGWERITPGAGATFAAESAEGDADVTLWVEEDPKLTMAEFEKRSTQQLESGLGEVEVVDRVSAPTPEASLVHLAVSGTDRYEVILRQNGDFSYYLATTLKSDASSQSAEDVELIQKSFVPEGGN
jgi:hypothetical protein